MFLLTYANSPPQEMARPEGFAHEYLPFPTQYIINLFSSSLIVVVKNAIDTQLKSLDLRWTGIHKTGVAVGEVSQNVWNRAYRREQQKRLKSGGTETAADQDKKVALAFRVSVFEEPEKKIVIDWLRGTDVQLWESFCGMLHRHFRNP
jgi:23S rRNA (adenine1618-N6)-methyltransferase